MLSDTATISCPYCWAGFPVQVDSSAGDQDYFEDCPVCCHPVRLRYRLNESGGLLELEALRDDE